MWLITFQESKAKWYIDIHRKIFATGKIKPNQILILPEGIASMKRGLQYMQEGKVNATNTTVPIGVDVGWNLKG
jgi:hypothetical protein